VLGYSRGIQKGGEIDSSVGERGTECHGSHCDGRRSNGFRSARFFEEDGTEASASGVSERERGVVWEGLEGFGPLK
jgi:hypothetical protein